MRSALLPPVFLCFVLLSACFDVKGGSDDSGGGSGGGGGQGGECKSTQDGVPADVGAAIEATCDHEVDCGVTACDACVTAYEDGYLASEELVQEQYAYALSCFEELTCTEWQEADFSRCVGATCTDVYCGSDNSVCTANGCGSCASDGYCS